MEKYSDPSAKEVQEYLKEFSTLKTKGQVLKFIHEVFPGWIMEILDGYSSDYPHLQKNWETICEKIGNNITPQKIILVSDIPLDEKHTLLHTISESITRNGFVVRRVTEFIRCQNCRRAIPAYSVWKMMKEKNLPTPEKWSVYCTSCTP